MRKLNILKAIVDFVWILTWIALPLIIIVSIVVLFNKDERKAFKANLNAQSLYKSNKMSI